MRGAVMRMDSREYAKALEDERRKIQVFQRELPLCFELVTQAIESCRQQLSETTTEELNGVQSDCSEQLSREVSPVLEEFIPVKRSVSSDSDDEEQQSARKINKSTDEKILGQSDWLRSAQLWNQTPNLLDKQDGPKKGSVMEVKRNGGAFQPFHREKTVDEKKIEASVVAKAPSSATPTAETGSGSGGSGGSSRGEGREGSSQRKQRRCWSPELHRRFLHALQQLGGSQCATPKQIRELMKVDGLTNDEVKSHLQKYRLHTRRPSHVIHGNNSCSSSSPAEAAHLVVVGGIWVSPPEYAAAMSAVTGKPGGVAATNDGGGGVYAPVALPPPQQPPCSVICSNSNQYESEEKRVISINRSEGGASTLSSSSTHTSN